MNHLKRESYRTMKEAEQSRDRWNERGYHAHIDNSYASINKYVVVVK